MEFKEVKYDLVDLDGTMTDIDLNDRANWFYVQVESSIRFVFYCRDCENILPDVVFVDKSMENVGLVTFALSGFNGTKSNLLELHKNKPRIIEMLNQTAEGNSTDEIKYRFEFI